MAKTYLRLAGEPPVPVGKEAKFTNPRLMTQDDYLPVPAYYTVITFKEWALDEENIPSFAPDWNHYLVAVEPVPGEEKTKGGIIVPIKNPEEEKLPMAGVVLKVGLNQDEMQMPHAVGDTIMFSAYAGVVLTFEGRTFKLIRSTDVFGRIPDVK